MGATLSGDGIIIGADIDIGRIQQAVNKMKSLMEDFAGGTSAAVQKADKELEKGQEKRGKSGRSSPPRTALKQLRGNWTD